MSIETPWNELKRRNILVFRQVHQPEFDVEFLKKMTGKSCDILGKKLQPISDEQREQYCISEIDVPS